MSGSKTAKNSITFEKYSGMANGKRQEGKGIILNMCINIQYSTLTAIALRGFSATLIYYC